MTSHSFEEVMTFFGEKLASEPAVEDVESGEVELVVDEQTILIGKGKEEGSLHITFPIVLLVQPVPKERLEELLKSNFLGVDTGGCSFEVSESGSLLILRASTTAGTSPQENWEWLHRVVHIGTEWNRQLVTWEECVPLKTPKVEEVQPPESPQWKA